ncbi:hypothetical protein SAMN05444008_1243 [Cnuella takakiae]|uniref:Uncharacterized protein n=1 Tax=Cnuella takakiae TaxID=1302690 RepID=A0A1M5II55_9BACT|nr:hypothetical protein [Cnuella takakiae]OLY92196.1 hypothetical protein BUE76_10040 [Cnuella takakiae]SHG28054.1 hypothetical protein SAMN05444008_1243 [Cnuella takakiae]
MEQNHFIKDLSKQEQKLELQTRKWVKVLFLILSFLWTAHLFCLYLKLYYAPSQYPDAFVRYFSLEYEANLPTLVSSLLIVGAAFLLFVIGKLQPNNLKKHWFVLSGIMLFLGIDESTRIHETLGALFAHVFSGRSSFAANWMFPYALLSLAAFIFFLPWLLHLPSRLKRGMLISGFIYVFGALGVEIIEIEGEQFLTEQQWIYFLNTTITVQEIMEMGGMFLFVRTLLHHLSYLRAEFSVVFRFASPESVAPGKAAQKTGSSIVLTPNSEQVALGK